MRLQRKDVVHGLLDYCSTVENTFCLASYYDPYLVFLSWMSKRLNCEASQQVLGAISRAKTELVKDGWLLKRTFTADKQYAGEPTYVTEYSFPKDVITSFGFADTDEEKAEILSEIPYVAAKKS